MGQVSEYVATLDAPDRAAVERVLDRARALVADTEEGTSYGMPALRYRGKPLLSVVVTSAHIGLYPYSPRAIEDASGLLSGFSTSKGTVRFSADHPLPQAAVDALVLARRSEIDAPPRRRGPRPT